MECTYLGAHASNFLRISKVEKNISAQFQRRGYKNYFGQSLHEPFTLQQMDEEKFKLNAASTNNPQFDATHDLIKPT